MPRSIKRPQTGSIVWYYSAVPPGAPLAAIVVRTITRTQFDLCTFAADGTTAPALAVNYYEGGTRPTTGAWCTYMRVVENPATKWPKDAQSEGPLGPGGVVVT